MKIIKIIIAAIAFMVLCSFVNKPDKIQRRRGIMNVDANGKVTFTPLEDWQPFTPVNDTLFQYRVD